jgi:hypothetical protein
VEFTPVWLLPDDVVGWMRKRTPLTDVDVDALGRVCAQTELYVQRCRPDQWTYTTPVPPEPPPAPTYAPDAEVYQGAVMYAARLYRRRSSPKGTEQYAGQGANFTAQDDDDVNRALRTGPFNVPAVG